MRLTKHAYENGLILIWVRQTLRIKEAGLQTEVSQTSLKMSIIKTGANDHMPVINCRGMSTPKILETSSVNWGNTTCLTGRRNEVIHETPGGGPGIKQVLIPCMFRK